MLKVGKPAPAFKAQAYFPESRQMAEVSSEDYKGKWLIVVFYPADFTFSCPTELSAIGAKKREFSEKNIEVVAISTDKVFAHMIWSKTSPAVKKFRYPMLADPTGEISRAFDVYVDEAGLSLRGVFVIDPDGIVQTATVHNLAIGRNSDEIERQVLAAQFARANPGKGIPANWMPGEAAIDTGSDMVGQI